MRGRKNLPDPGDLDRNGPGFRLVGVGGGSEAVRRRNPHREEDPVPMRYRVGNRLNSIIP